MREKCGLSVSECLQYHGKFKDNWDFHGRLPKPDNTIDTQGGLETSDDARKAQLSQVVNYSEFLNELAAQRHSIVSSYLKTSVVFTGYRQVVERSDKLLAEIDGLIRDVLRHIEGSDLVALSEEPK